MTIEEMLEVLEDAKSYFDNRSDVEGDSEHLTPNTEMRLSDRLTLVIYNLEKAKSDSCHLIFLTTQSLINQIKSHASSTDKH